MISSFFSKRSGTTRAGIFSVALASVLLLCGAGSVPIENFLPQGPMQADLNAGAHSITNTATVSGANVIANALASGTSGAMLTNLNGYSAESLSAGNSSVLASLGRISEDTITLNAGSGAYVVNRSLQDSGAQAGDVWEINVSYPASTNPTLNIYDNNTSGALLVSSSGTAAAGSTTLQFVFNGTSWVHYSKGAVLSKNLGSGVSTALGNAMNAAGGLTTFGTDLALAGGTMSGAIAMGANNITGVGAGNESFSSYTSDFGVLEALISVNSANGANAVAIENTNSQGYSANTYVNSAGHERMAIGTGNASTTLFPNTCYIECSNQSGVPNPFSINMDGNYGSGYTFHQIFYISSTTGALLLSSISGGVDLTDNQRRDHRGSRFRQQFKFIGSCRRF